MRQLLTLVMVICATGVADAQAALYTFEAPNFTHLEHTPILNRAPNSGFPSISTSFTSSPVTDNYLITTGGGLNSLLTGEYLIGQSSTVDTLTITFSLPITSFQVNFAINDTVAGGHLAFISPAGNTDQTASFNGGTFPGGVLAFSSSTPFNTATLDGFKLSGAPTQLGIDNLQVTLASVPEPTSLFLAGATSLAAGAAWCYRRSRSSSKKS